MAANFRLNLRNLLLAFVYASVCLTLISWRPSAGLLISVALAAAIGVFFGIQTHNGALKVFGSFLVAIICCIFYLDTSRGVMGIGRCRLHIAVNIVDSSTGKPVPWARVQLVEEGRDEFHSLTTALDGCVKFSKQLCFTSHKSLFGLTRSTSQSESFAWLKLVVKADEYQPAEVLIAKALGKDRLFTPDEAVAPVVIELKSKKGS